MFKSRVYVCHTYYHVYVTLLKEFALPKQEQGKATLILSKMSSDFADLKERLIEQSLFEAVVDFDEKPFWEFDELKKYKYRTLSELSNRLSFNNDDKFLDKILQTYLNIDRDNYNARITILYCLYTHISIKYGIIPMVPQFYWRCYERLFSYTKLNLSFDQREILILELSTMILINKCFY